MFKLLIAFNYWKFKATPTTVLERNSWQCVFSILLKVSCCKHWKIYVIYRWTYLSIVFDFLSMEMYLNFFIHIIPLYRYTYVFIFIKINLKFKFKYRICHELKPILLNICSNMTILEAGMCKYIMHFFFYFLKTIPCILLKSTSINNQSIFHVKLLSKTNLLNIRLLLSKFV